MNSRRAVPITLIIIAVMANPGRADDEDDAFRQFINDGQQSLRQANADFEQYKKELESDFSLYKKAYEQAVAQQKQRMTQTWGDYRPGDKTHWVIYGDDTRTSVDFESGQIDVEIIVPEQTREEDVRLNLEQRLTAIMSMSEADAFQADQISAQVEAQLQQSGKRVMRDQLRSKKMFESLMPELQGKSPANTNRIEKSLIRNANVEQRKAPIAGKKIIHLHTKAPVDMPERARRFKSSAEKVAAKEQVPIALIFAVIESESGFNPMAKSPIPAYGLMQIVPRSAGRDATAYLYGSASVLSPSYLYNADNNIRIGGAYLHILFHNYLKDVTDPVSRLYCAIAAYNTGAGNVARAFVGNTDIKKAAMVINRMAPKDVYNKLRSDLPHDETRKYMKKVATRLAKYQG